MNSPLAALDLTKSAPHSPRARVAGFAIALRSADKCRATAAGTQGAYHYDCPLDRMLFDFKGITGEEFQAAIRAPRTNEEIGVWLTTHGTAKTPMEVKAWSDKMDNTRPIEDPARRTEFMANCATVHIDPERSTLFDWLDADDLATFRPKSAAPVRLIFNP